MIKINAEEMIKVRLSYNKGQTWYITKQELQFWKLCYAASILEEYKNKTQNKNLATYFKERSEEIKREKQFDKFITESRMLNNCYYLGLISKRSNTYEDADLTEVYYSIKKYCNGEFEKIELYYPLMENQIEKVFFSFDLDEEYNKKRSSYRIFPLFALYRILLNIGDVTGSYSISMLEFKSLVVTTETYKDCIYTTLGILDSRQDQELVSELKKLSTTFSDTIRYHRLLQDLLTLDVNDTKISIPNEMISYVREKVYLFEISPFTHEVNYVSRLCSNDKVIESYEDKKNEMERCKVDYTKIDKNEIDKVVPRNLIINGAPGTGKSNHLEMDYRKKFFNDDFLYVRTTFNANTTYSEFVGVYKPTPIYVKDGGEYYESNKIDLTKSQMRPLIDYTFVAGPFIEVLCRALDDSTHNYLLVIEEINRADTAAAFGDVFQLLDRVKETDGIPDEVGASTYKIKFSKDIMNYISSRVGNESIYFKKDMFVRIPNNMYIFATMNNADQQIKKMDTAFERRWEYEYMGLNSNCDITNNVYITFPQIGEIKWNSFRKKLNKFLTEQVKVTEDKLIGTFFLDYSKVDDQRYVITNGTIKHKLLMYLKNDVLRHNADKLFAKNYLYGDLVELFDAGKEIFNTQFVSIFEKTDEERK